VLDLSKCEFDLEAALRSDDFVLELNKGKDGLIRFPLACIILQDWDSISDPRWKEDILKWLCAHDGKHPAPLCTVPVGWRMPKYSRPSVPSKVLVRPPEMAGIRKSKKGMLPI